MLFTKGKTVAIETLTFRYPHRHAPFAPLEKLLGIRLDVGQAFLLVGYGGWGICGMS